MNSIILADIEVEALYEGRLKQIRRPVKELRGYDGQLEYQGLLNSDYYLKKSFKKQFAKHPEMFYEFLGRRPGELNPIHIKFPFGAPGNTLKVRETWGLYQPVLNYVKPDGRNITEISDGAAVYKADGYESVQDLKDHLKLMIDGCYDVFVKNDRFQSPATMPLIFSRSSVKVLSVRVERVQDISLIGIINEGLAKSIYDYPPVLSGFDRYKKYWKSRFPNYPYADNPWTWVAEIEEYKGGEV